MNRLVIALLAASLPSACLAQTVDHRVASTASGLVTTADPRATAAGQEILAKGGSAADAAMAVMLALTVVEPQSSGIGGGGFLVHHDPKSNAVETIDGRETAPMAARGDRFLGADGRPRSFVEAFPGGMSIGVPGNVRLMAVAEKKWGRLKWAAIFQPAIRLAEQGFVLNERTSGMITMVSPLWKDFPGIANFYSKNGQPLPAGTRVRNLELAKTLRRIAAGGPDAFYSGANAKALLDAAHGTGVRPSDMNAADLSAYRAKERPPVCAPYRQWKICGMGPPSSGATTVLSVLGMLERFDMKALGKDSPVAWHLIGEAMELAYADRDKYLGDPDFVSVPVKGLLDRQYLASRSALISETSTLAIYTPGTPAGAEARTAGPVPNERGTTHFIVIGRAGDVVSMTSTVEGPFGSQLLAGGYVLNNELTDFSFAPERNGAPVANRVEPGKRPLSSMAPTIVYDARGKVVFVVGAAGGKTIPMQVTKTLIAHLDWGLPVQAAVAEPVLFFNGQGLVAEAGTKLEAMIPELERLGNHVTSGTLPLKTNAAERVDGAWRGAADPRTLTSE